MAEYAAPCCAPIMIDNGSKEAVVYFHGCSSSPGHFLPYGREAVSCGYDVYAPLLPGHGTKVEDMLEYGWQDWQMCICETVEKLISRYDKVHICGHSLGGALAALAAGKYADTGKIGKVLVMCPGFGIGNKDFYSMDFDKVGKNAFPFVTSEHEDKEIRTTSFLYPCMYLKTVKDLIDNGEVCFAQAENITSPVTLLYSSADVICDVDIIAEFGRKVPHLKSLHIYERSGHNILTECEWKDCRDRVILWLREKM